jgi:(1->4)-alpha-D-glucan 1-alpha-D-glucosylmutase
MFKGPDRDLLIQYLVDDAPSGMVKIFVLWRLLAFRNSARDVFDDGEYVPLNSAGEKAAHVVAFARRTLAKTVVVAVPRLSARLLNYQPRTPGGKLWGDTEIELASTGGRATDVLTGVVHDLFGKTTLGLAQLFGSFPVAVLDIPNQ